MGDFKKNTPSTEEGGIAPEEMIISVSQDGSIALGGSVKDQERALWLLEYAKMALLLTDLED